MGERIPEKTTKGKRRRGEVRQGKARPDKSRLDKGRSTTRITDRKETNLKSEIYSNTNQT